MTICRHSSELISFLDLERTMFKSILPFLVNVKICVEEIETQEEYDAHVKLRTNFVQRYDYSRPCKIENLKQSIHNLF